MQNKFFVRAEMVRLTIFFALTSLLTSCGTTSPTPTPRYSTPAQPKNVTVRPPEKPTHIIPEGWADITSKMQSTGMLYFLVYKDLSATITLKEFSLNAQTTAAMQQEDICTLGNISLRTKISADINERQITRMPALLNGKKIFCSYNYTEKGMLRRVIVFKKRGKFYEAELVQEKPSAEFETISADQITFAESFIDGDTK